jgi:hypothetical protein
VHGPVAFFTAAGSVVLSAAVWAAEGPDKLYDPSSFFGWFGPLLALASLVLGAVAVYRTSLVRRLQQVVLVEQERADRAEKRLAAAEAANAEKDAAIARLEGRIRELEHIIGDALRAGPRNQPREGGGVRRG